VKAVDPVRITRRVGRVFGEVELGAAVHLSFEHLNDPANVALDGAGAVRKGECVEHGSVVAFEVISKVFRMGPCNRKALLFKWR